MARSGHTAEHDSQPVQYMGMATLTSLSSDSNTILGQIRAQAWQLVHFSSLITGLYMYGHPVSHPVTCQASTSGRQMMRTLIRSGKGTIPAGVSECRGRSL
jgi:hypothetical protein